MTFDPPKVKKPKTVYRYEAEAKALVGKVFADGNRIGKVIKAEKHRQDHTWRSRMGNGNAETACSSRTTSEWEHHRSFCHTS